MGELLLKSGFKRVARVIGSMNFFRREWIILALIAVAAAGLFAVAGHFYARPAVLRIAVGPPGSDDAQLIAGIAPRLVSDSAPFRWRQVVTETPAEAVKLLEEGKVNLAIVRQDQHLPTNGQAIAVFHQNVVVLVTKPSSGVTEIAQLAGKTIGAVGRNGVNNSILAELLPHYGLAREAVNVVTIGPGEVAPAIAEGRIAAALMAGPITGRAVTEVIAALAPDSDPDLVFIPFRNAEAIAKRMPQFEATEIDAGSFGGSPPRPPKPTPTVKFAHFLVASSTMRDTLAADVARSLFSLRPGLAYEFPAANRLEAPDTAKDAIVPVHPGAAAYFDGEEKTFFDQYSDIFYLALIGFGFVGSAFASIQRFAAPSGGVRDSELFQRVRALIEQVRSAASEEELLTHELELHDVFTVVLRKAEHNSLEDAQLSALSIAIQHLHRTIDARRVALHRMAAVAQNSS